MNYFEHALYKSELEDIVAKNCEILRNKTIVITGARGLIGSMLVDAIMYANTSRSAECNVFAILRNREQGTKRFCQYQSSPFFHMITADINYDEIRINENIDFFIHAASNTHPIFYSTRPIETILTNTVGTNRVLQFAVEHNCKRFVFMSSVEIYGENRGDTDKFSEDYCGYIDCNTLRAGYPESKRVGESLCQAYRKEKGLECVIARIARCYGPGLLQEDSKALTQFLRKATAGENIILKSDGKQYYSYVYVADAVDALLFISAKGEDGTAYNIVGKESDVTLKELSTFIAEKAGRKVLFDLPDKLETEGYSKATKALLDGGRLEKLGWSAKVDIERGIEDILSCWRGR